MTTKNIKMIRLLQTLALLAMLPAVLVAGEVYDQSYKALMQYPNRLPGSENLSKAQEELISILGKHGIELHKMTYNTLVPEVKTCRLESQGKQLGPVYPLAPNGVALNTTGPEGVSGPLVYLGNATLGEMKGKVIRDRIAVVEFGSQEMHRVFSRGAKAIIFVNNDKANQWNIASHFTEMPVNFPRLWVDRKIAEQQGFLTADGTGPDARLLLHTQWKDAVAVNLWAELPGEEGAVFNLKSEEYIVLSATIDTFGAVPDVCPQPRWAANAALLAETAVKLSKTPRKRSIFITFFGSHYSGYDGSRMFFYALRKGEKGPKNPDPLPLREEYYQNELKDVREMSNFVSQKDFLKQDGHPLRFSASKRMREKVDARVNEMNFEMTELALDNYTYQETHDGESNQELVDRYELIKNEKSKWNDMKRQLTEYNIEDFETFNFLLKMVRNDLDARIDEIEALKAHNKTYQKIADRVVRGEGEEQMTKRLVGHFHFDFADTKSPWLYNYAGDTSLVYTQSVADDRLPPGSFDRIFSVLNKEYDKIEKKEWEAKLHRQTQGGLYRSESLVTPRERILPTQGAHTMEAYSFCLNTVANPLMQDELPTPKYERNLSVLSNQMRDVFANLTATPELSIRSVLNSAKLNDSDFVYRYVDGSLNGATFVNYSKGSSEIEGPSAGLLAYAYGMIDLDYAVTGHTRIGMARINEDGYLFLPNIRFIGQSPWNRATIGFDDYGVVKQVNDRTVEGTGGSNVRSFYAYGGAYMHHLKPELYDFAWNAKHVLDATASDSPYKYKHEQNPLSKRFGLLYISAKRPFKLIANGIIMLGSTEDKPMGKGVTVNSFDLLNLDVTRQSAEDLSVLNSLRLTALKERNISNDALEYLQSEAKVHLNAATKAREQRDPEKAFAHDTFALALGYRAYEPLLDVSNDMVKAVVILLILAIPFAFVMERLCFGFTSIYKQVAGFSLIFLATFGLLFLVHPAFSLAQAPVVIFLAFVIIVMSALVILIMMGKFQQQIKTLQGMSSKVHGASSDSSTGTAAVLIGISGMRNRPLKTFLTASTVVLLTFTILVFASFTSKIGVTESYLGEGSGNNRIELHRPNFFEVPDSIVDTVDSLYRDDFEITKRNALIVELRRFIQPPENVLYNPKNGKSYKLVGAVGFQKKEVSKVKQLKKALPGFEYYEGDIPPIYLSALAEKTLGLVKGDEVRMRGYPFRYAGQFDAPTYQSVANIDDSKALVPDYETLLLEQNIRRDKFYQIGSLVRRIDPNNIVWSSVDGTAITTFDALKPLDAFTNFVSLFPRGDTDIEKAAEQISNLYRDPVYAKGPEGAKQFFFTTSVEGTGFSEILVPLLLGGLIIFSSLLGSIVDREKEIFTFSALGLAPTDVASLFLAEAGAYAIVGGMGGYLVSQLVAKILTILSEYGFFQPPEMNFSSLSSIMTILLVMATVLLSAAYPASKAGKSANPGVARKWKMPQPEGDLLKFVFPFTVSATDLGGILSFIKEHFDNHSDASLGNFASRETHIFSAEAKGGPGNLGIASTVSLAPFDLGVFQKFQLYSKDSEIEGIKEVVVELERINGAPGAWIRGNRAFIDELRNQFLLWRSLPIETIEHYRAETEDTLEKV